MISKKEFKRLIGKLNGYRPLVGAGDKKLTVEILKTLVSVGPGLNDEQREEATRHALRIFLTDCSATNMWYEAAHVLRVAGTGHAVIPIYEWILSLKVCDVESVNRALDLMAKILEREKSKVSDSTLTKIATLGPIPAVRLILAEYYEPDEIRVPWEKPEVVDCKVIRDLARLELNRRTQI